MTTDTKSRFLRVWRQEGYRPFDLDAKFADAHIDSLDFLSLIAALEKEFDIEIPVSAVIDFETVGQLVAWVETQQP